MLQTDIERLASSSRVHTQRHGLADSEFRAHEVHLVVWLDLLVVVWVDEGEWEHTLLLEVGLVLLSIISFC